MNCHSHDFKQVCRSCLESHSNLKCIFEVKVSKTKQILLTDFIRRLTSLKISRSEEYPDKICERCVEKFEQAYKAAEMFLESDIKLKSKKFKQGKTIVVHKLQKGTHLKNVRLPKRELSSNNENKKEKVQQNKIKTIKMLYEEQGASLEQEENENFTDDATEQLNSPDSSLKDKTEYQESIKIIVEKDKPTVKIRRPRKNLKCSNCNKPFSNAKLLRKHVVVCDPNKPHQCKICNERFQTQKELNRHEAKECEQDKNYICDVCGQKFRHEHLLKIHSYKHTVLKPYPCPKCPKGCVTAEGLRRHMTIHDKNHEKKSHSCIECNKEFPYKSYLAEHMKTHTGEKPFLCSLCGRGFRQSGALAYHLRSHTKEKPYECSVCQKRFTIPGVLKVHMRSHTNERPYVCDICGMAFRQSTDMKTHRRNIHTGDKPILCTLCGKKMSSTGQLTVHLRSHTGEKPYSCTICSKSFSTKTTLVKHKRIHTGDRPYKCSTCGKAFNQASTLNTHIKIHKNKDVFPTKNNENDKLNLNQIVKNNCLILEINEAEPAQVVQVEQIQVSTADQVIILPTPVPLI